MLGKIESRRRREQQKMRWLDGIIDIIGMSWSKLWEIVKDREAWRAAVMGLQRLGYNLATKQQSSRSLANIFSHSHYIDSFLYCATFDVVPFVYFYFCFPCLKRHIKKKKMLDLCQKV